MTDCPPRVVHPARIMPFSTLLSGLERARDAGAVTRKFDAVTGRSLWTYTARCTYENLWDDYSLLARGLILDEAAGEVVATPFPKFFNAGEGGRPIPTGPFDCYEKLDGSLIIIHQHKGRWRAATKGSFDSDQARWAEARLQGENPGLAQCATYLCEAIYAENRIVVSYPTESLVLLGAYDQCGNEADPMHLVMAAKIQGWRLPRIREYGSFDEMAADAKALPGSEEGYVVRFRDGTRLKVKGDEYKRLHALASNVTPLAMWSAMVAGDDMGAIRRDLPEEFLGDFDGIVAALDAKIYGLAGRIAEAAASVADRSDRELGQSLASVPEDVRPFVFPWRKHGGQLSGRTRETLYRAIRPTGNVLQGYIPSFAAKMVADEQV